MIVSKIEFLHGNAEELSQIPSNSMDAYTIAFGIRNCTHMDKVLQEAYRVLKPNGHFLCLEFSRLEDARLQTYVCLSFIMIRLYDLYSFHMIPWVGKIVASDADSYQYLVESIRNFPNQQDFKKMIEESGFKAVSFENLFYGLVAIHHGWKV
jgi:2-methoxy-6-polyprenyl-1,4-benzoquinol methylase